MDAQTQLCLDSQADAVSAGQCNGQASQQWAITPDGDPNVTIANAQTGLCLDTAYENPASSPVAAVFTDQCGSSPTQQWYLGADSAENGQLVFMNVQTGMVLDSDDTGAVYANSANGGTYQNWTVTQYPALPAFSGSFPSANTTLQDAQTNLCLDDNSGTVQTDQCGADGSQQWSVMAAGNPEVVIANVQTGLCLNSNYQNPADPSVGAIFTSTCDGSNPSQYWFLTGNGQGSFVFMNMLTGRLLDSNYAGAAYGDTANGGNYQNWTASVLPQFPALVTPRAG
jgi:hypothetical protein